MSERSFRDTLAIVTAVSFIFGGCSVTKRGQPRIAKEFVGIWRNVEPKYHNWWEISRGKVVNYGVALGHGKCVGHEATIVSPRQIDVGFGNAGRPTLRIQDGYLVLGEGQFQAVHVRVRPEDICRNADGYFEGAPYAKR